MIKKIITHDGQFHADEVFAVALLLRVFGLVPVVRTRVVTKEDLDDPEIWVLDQYGQYDRLKHNFDHHQDKELPATDMLILNYLYDENHVSADFHALVRRPMNAISDYDTKGPIPFNGFQVNEFFKTLNNLEDGFGAALAIAQIWFDGTEAMINKKAKALEYFASGRSIEGIIKVCKEYPILWTTMGSEKLLVAPEKGQWRLHSADTVMYPIVPTGKEIFLHTNFFIASYKNKEDAVEAAKLTARIESRTPLM